MVIFTLANAAWFGLSTMLLASGMTTDGTIMPRYVPTATKALPNAVAEVEPGNASQPAGKSAIVQR